MAGEGFVNCGDSYWGWTCFSVAEFSAVLLFQEDREARGQGGSRSVGKQVVGMFQGDSLPGSQARVPSSGKPCILVAF